MSQHSSDSADTTHSALGPIHVVEVQAGACLRSISAKIVGQWFRSACLLPEVRQYLYFRPANGASGGALCVSADAPPGFQLADPTPLHGAMTQDQARHQLLTLARQLPVLPSQ